jgi:hypothetical protein
MKCSDPGLCPIASFGRNSTEYVGSITSYSFPTWHGLQLETENVKTLTPPEANSEVISNYK